MQIIALKRIAYLKRKLINNYMTPKEQLTKDRRQILSKMTVEKAEKYPELYSNLFGQADTMYRFNLLNSKVISND